MGIQVTFYALIGLLVAVGIVGIPLSVAVFLAGLGQGVAFPRLFATVLGDVPPAQAGVAAGITNSALQIGAAVSVAAIGSLFFMVLGGRTGERAYAHAFAIAQWTATAGLFLAMLIAIPPRAAPASGCIVLGHTCGISRSMSMERRMRTNSVQPEPTRLLSAGVCPGAAGWLRHWRSGSHLRSDPRCSGRIYCDDARAAVHAAGLQSASAPAWRPAPAGTKRAGTSRGNVGAADGLGLAPGRRQSRSGRAVAGDRASRAARHPGEG